MQQEDDGPEIGPGAPNLRNYNESTGVNLSPKYMVNSSFAQGLFHLVAVVLSIVMYMHNWCFLLSNEDVQIHPRDEVS
jgi:hypothetical protein